MTIEDKDISDLTGLNTGQLVDRLHTLQEYQRDIQSSKYSDIEVIRLQDAVSVAEKALEASKTALANELVELDVRMGWSGAEIEATEAMIIKLWDGTAKTITLDDGKILKFRTTHSLQIVDETLVLTGLLDHTSVKDVAANYITGFNKTAVKKYMSVLDLPMGATEIHAKTTVKLECNE